jgi:hypothetical protein
MLLECAVEPCSCSAPKQGSFAMKFFSHNTSIVAFGLALGGVLGGCGGGGDSDPAGGGSDMAASADSTSALMNDNSSCGGRGDSLDALTVTDAAGLSLSVVEVTPSRPIAGDNAWTVQLSDGDGPVSGVADQVFVSLFMPDHGHGSPTVVGVAEVSEGIYELSPVNLFMPGYWEVSVEVPLDDPASPSVVEFGICVE